MNLKKILVAASVGTALAVTGALSASAADRPLDTGSNFHPSAPVRILDTRSGVGAPKAALPGSGTLTLTVAGVGSVPADVTAVQLNITAVSPQATGYLTAFPDGVIRPLASNLDFQPGGPAVANAVTVPVTNGKIDLFNGSGGTVQLIADLEGWYTAAPAPYTAPSPITQDLGAVASVPTGGGFVANATEVGTLDLKAGTYQVSLNAKATPNATFATANPTVQVFPQFFVYDQAKNAAFTGDRFNVGSGALESGGNANIDSYFSGSSTVTLDADTTLHFYAFGYDSDRGAGSYTLDDLSVSAVPLG